MSMITSLLRVNSLPNGYLEEEKALINGFDERQWIKLLNRRVQHYGFEFVYGANNVDRARKLGDMPEFLSSIIQSKGSFCVNDTIGIEEKLKRFTFNERNEVIEAPEEGSEAITSFLDKYGSFDQLTINDYQPGQGIPPHVDTHSPFEEIFVSLSLKSGVSMNFRTPEGVQKDVYLMPRSLLLFSGEARYNYLHSISTRKLDKVDGLLRFRHRRLSLTFRKLKTDGGPCTCRFPKLCDSQNS